MPDIRCPNCECRTDDYRDTDRNRGIARCDDCEFEFSYRYFPRQLRYTVNGAGYSHEYTPNEEPDDGEPETNKVFIATSGEGENFHIVQMYTKRTYADRLAGRQTEFSVVEHDCRDKPTGNVPFTAFVVSVGEGEQYRIVEISADRTFAVKIATSIRGTISKYDVVPSDRTYQDVKYYKWFVRLDGGDRVTRVDYFFRKMSLCEQETAPPIVTHRRRYSDSLPWRLEVAAPSSEVAGSIANQIANMTNTEIKALYEYNVDYDMVKDGDNWVIDPVLLEMELV